MRDFRKLEIWKEAMNLTDQVYQISSAFPSNEKFGLISQIRRCGVSIPSNIAEGCRGSSKELVHFLNIALGSSFELETQIEIAFRQDYLQQEKFDETIDQIHTLQKRINAFRSYIKNQFHSNNPIT